MPGTEKLGRRCNLAVRAVHVAPPSKLDRLPLVVKNTRFIASGRVSDWSEWDDGDEYPVIYGLAHDRRSVRV